MSLSTYTPPYTLRNDLFTMVSGGQLLFNSELLANDQGSGFVSGAGNVTTHGTVVYGSGLFLFRPQTGFTGIASFDYKIATPTEVLPGMAYVVVLPAQGSAPSTWPVMITSVQTHANPAAGLGSVTVVPGDGMADPRPTLQGIGAPGTAVTVRDGTTVVGTTTVDAQGHWTLTPTADLALGDHSFVANGDTANAYPVTRSWLTPGDESLATTANTAASFTAADLLANDTALGGAQLSLKSFGVPQHGTITQTTAGYTYTPAAGYSGPDEVSYTVTDQFGHLQTETVHITVNTKYQTPVIVDVYDDVSNPPGVVGGDTIDTRPTIRGTGEPGMTVELYDNGVQMGTTVVAADGSWSFTPATDMALGVVHNVTPVGVAPDGSGTTPASNIAVFTVVAPQAPGAVIDFVADNFGPTQGPASNGSDDPTPTFYGTAPAGSTLTFSDGTTTLGHVVVAADGTWTFTTPTLATGTHDLVIHARNLDGTSRDTPYSYTVTADQAGPVVTSIVDDAGPVQGPLLNGATTDDTQPTLSGTGEPGSTVSLHPVNADGLPMSTKLAEGQVDASGHWTLTTTVLPAGLNQMVAVTTAPSQAAVFGSEVISLTIGADTTTGAHVLDPVLTGTHDNVGAQQGNIEPGGSMNDRRPTFSGTAEPDTVVDILDNGQLLGQVTVDASWQWSYTPGTNLALGQHSITLLGHEADGSGATPSVYAYDYTITASDNVSGLRPLLAPVITSLTDDKYAAAHTIASGGVGHDDTPALAGTAEPGSVVDIFDGGTLLGSALADADWQWSFTAHLNNDFGQHTFTAAGHRADGTGESTPAWYAQDYDLQPIAMEASAALDTLLAQAGLAATTPAATAVNAASATPAASDVHAATPAVYVPTLHPELAA